MHKVSPKYIYIWWKVHCKPECPRSWDTAQLRHQLSSVFADVNRSSVHLCSTTHPHWFCLSKLKLNRKNWNWILRTDWVRRAEYASRIKWNFEANQFIFHNTKFTFRFTATQFLRINFNFRLYYLNSVVFFHAMQYSSCQFQSQIQMIKILVSSGIYFLSPPKAIFENFSEVTQREKSLLCHTQTFSARFFGGREGGRVRVKPISILKSSEVELDGKLKKLKCVKKKNW